MTAHQTPQARAGSAPGFGKELNDAIRENPVAAGLIGMGVLWMVLGGGKVSNLAGAARSVTGAAAQATGNAIGEAIGGTGTRVKDAARQVSDAISFSSEGAATVIRNTLSAGHDAVTSSGRNVSQTVSQTASGAGRSSIGLAREFATAMQENLSHSLERQPLLLGAIGLAIGAGIASAFPSTNIEKDMMGEAGGAVREKIQQFATDSTEFATQRAKQVLDAVKDEATTRGLTFTSAKETLKDVGGKMKAVASSSRDSIKDRLS